METGLNLHLASVVECGCCHMNTDSAGGDSCADRSKVFTERELAVLHRIRDYGERAKEIRRSIERMNGHSESLTLKKTALDELDRLRFERAALEEERLAAAQERMRWLGHA
ncbi:MAG: hypothetical protein MUF52_12180 [Syntrophobacteraceae bacterium]|jgi:hypothetical protein|nr:hypothetical protein [Syntrophobacteraceae bacterium]